MQLKYSELKTRPDEDDQQQVQQHIDEHLAAGWRLKHYNSVSEVRTVASGRGLLGVNNHGFMVTSTLVHTFVWEAGS